MPTYGVEGKPCRIACILTLGLSLTAPAQVVFTHGVSSGEVTPTSAILWSRVNQAGSLTAEVWPDSDNQPGSRPVIRRQVAATADSDFTVRVLVGNLTPGQSYSYRFQSPDGTSPTGRFKTPPRPTERHGVTFTWSSDTDGSFSPPLNQFEALDRAREENGDFFIYLGDTVYMDTHAPVATDLVSMRDKYKEVRAFPALQNLLASGSTYAIWDDHEIHDNFSGQTVDPVRFSQAVQAFQEYLPVGDWSPSKGFFRTVRWGKHLELFILDERSFRSANADVACLGDLAPVFPAEVRTLLGLAPAPPPGCLETLYDPRRTMLGTPQFELFTAALRASDATWKVVVNEVPISLLFALPYDRWEGFGYERERLLTFLRSSGVKNVVFVTGDLHANLVSDVRGITDPTPVAKEFVTGPVSEDTLLHLLAGLLGSEPAATGFLGLLTAIVQPDCLNANAFSYGVARIDGDTGQLQVNLKDDAGGVLCSAALLPQ